MLNIIKVNTHEFEISEHSAHREAFSKYVLCYHTCSSALNVKKKREPCAGEVIYRLNRFYVFMSYHIFAHLVCSCIASCLATLALLYVRSIMFEDLCSFLSKKKKVN